MSVLLVEDDADIRDALRTLLEEEGCRVRTAVNGREALAACAGPDEPTLIVLDLMMPEMDGWTFLERRRQDERLAAIPVVVTTASHSAAVQGVEQVFRKPYDLDALAGLVARHCGLPGRRTPPRRESPAERPPAPVSRAG